ncbi:MAG: hypothetical protein JXB88_09085 [Spirochaetales bacterium]|nr:hypothetical protein [Spirochaetales bacterium]
MLKEFINVRQEKNGYRRLFTDEDIDLYIWYDDSKENIRGFQLVYGKRHDDMKAFTWERDKGTSHTKVDDEGWYNPSPILAAPIPGSDSIFNKEVVKSFKKKSKNLDKPLVTFILEKMKEYGKR